MVQLTKNQIVGPALVPNPQALGLGPSQQLGKEIPMTKLCRISGVCIQKRAPVLVGEPISWLVIQSRNLVVQGETASPVDHSSLGHILGTEILGLSQLNQVRDHEEHTAWSEGCQERGGAGAPGTQPFSLAEPARTALETVSGCCYCCDGSEMETRR